MSVKWQQNHWLWMAAICAVGGVVALSPEPLSVERHGRAVKPGRPLEVERALSAAPTELTLDPLPPPSLPSSNAIESLQAKALPSLPPAPLAPPPITIEPIHFPPVEEHDTVTLSLPDRVDPIAVLPPVSSVTYETRLPEVTPPQRGTDSIPFPDLPVDGPLIIPGPGHYRVKRPSATAGGSCPVRLSGGIVTDDAPQ